MPKANDTDIYKYNEYPSLLDYLFGADFEDYKKNKSFRLNSIIQLINNVNGINNLQFIFSDGSDPDVDYFDKGYFFTDNNETNPYSFTKLILNKESLQPINLTLLFERLASIENLVIKLENPANPNNFFNFRITGITDETDFFVFDVVVFEDFFFGELLNETIYSVYFDIKTDGIVQDNIKKEILINCPAEITLANFATIINALASFSISQTEIPTFKAVSSDAIPITHYVELLNIGKGNYGVGGTVLNTSNIKVTSFGATATDIEDLPTTQTIDLGYEGDDVVTALNRQLPNIVIQDQNEGYVIIKGIFALGAFSEYLWIGTGGSYGGSGGLQSSFLDFKELSNPVVYTKEETDALLNEKLPKGTYDGDAGILDERITTLEGVQAYGNRFTGKSYALWSGSGLTYDVIYTSYYIDNILYPGATVQRTLSAADATNPRFDLIAVDATGAIVITGTASASPEIPTVDPNTQLSITPALVGAGALTPTGVSNENIYIENSEWTPTTNNGTINFNASANPFQGTKHIDCGAFTNGQYLKFVDNITNQIADFGQIGLAINLKNTFSNSTKFSIRLYNGVTGISSTVVINSGTYNFDRTVVNAYQLIVIPISAFTFSSSDFDRVDIVMVGANPTGFKLDNIILYKGSSSNSPEQNAITSIITDSGIANATTKDDTFQFKGANGLLVSAIGKIITFTSNFTTALKSNYDSAYAWVQSHQNVDNTSDVSKPVSTAQAAADAATLASAQTYASNLITQLINGAPADGNTLKELSDKILAVQAIIGGSTADGDALVNTVAELLAVMATFPEGVDLVTLLAGKVNTTDIYNALDCIVAGKVADARQVKVLNDLITTLRADVNANTTAIGLRELSSNKSQDIETDKASTTKFSSIKAFYDWCVGRFQPKLVAGANIAIDNTNSLAPVISASSSGNVINAVLQISGTKLLSSTDNGLVLILTANCTVTIPNGLPANFECTLVTLAGATLTIAQGGSVALLNNAGTTMAEKLSCTIKNTLTTNQYLTVGNL